MIRSVSWSSRPALDQDLEGVLLVRRVQAAQVGLGRGHPASGRPSRRRTGGGQSRPSPGQSGNFLASALSKCARIPASTPYRAPSTSGLSLSYPASMLLRSGFSPVPGRGICRVRRRASGRNPAGNASLSPGRPAGISSSAAYCRCTACVPFLSCPCAAVHQASFWTSGLMLVVLSACRRKGSTPGPGVTLVPPGVEPVAQELHRVDPPGEHPARGSYSRIRWGHSASQPGRGMEGK